MPSVMLWECLHTVVETEFRSTRDWVRAADVSLLKYWNEVFILRSLFQSVLFLQIGSFHLQRWHSESKTKWKKKGLYHNYCGSSNRWRLQSGDKRHDWILHIVLTHCRTITRHTETEYIMAKKTAMTRQETISSSKQDGQTTRCLLVTFPLRAPSVIGGVRGREIHQNSLCRVRYTEEPLRIRDGLLCLWLSTLRPIPSSPRPAWCELINHSNGLTRQTVPHAALHRCTPFLRSPTHSRGESNRGVLSLHFWELLLLWVLSFLLILCC